MKVRIDVREHGNGNFSIIIDGEFLVFPSMKAVRHYLYLNGVKLTN